MIPRFITAGLSGRRHLRRNGEQHGTPKSTPGTYKVRDHFGTYRTIEIDNLLVAARHAALGRFVEQPTLSTPGDTTRYLEAALGHLEHERFCAIWLDNRHRVIRFDELSRGTIDGASVYPREVVKAALSVNAAACIFAHNHPSGIAEPSQADERITQRLKSALALVDIRVLDHIVIGQTSVSFAERGLL